MLKQRKRLTRELYDILCPWSGKAYLDNFKVFYVHELGKRNYRTLPCFMLQS